MEGYNFKYPSSINNSSSTHYRNNKDDDEYWIFFTYNNIAHKLTDAEIKQYKINSENIKGKWMLFVKDSDVDKFWLIACFCYVNRELHGVISMKVSTFIYNPRASNASQKVICFYTQDPFDEEYTKNIGINIIDKLNLKNTVIVYKLNEQTKNGTRATGQKNNSIYKIVSKDLIFSRTKGFCEYSNN